MIPDLRGSSSTYVINNANPSGSCFLSPVAPDDAAGASANLIIDDRYSSVIGIGFPFNFFGITYTQLVISANGYLSFDVTRATKFSHFGILKTGTPPFLTGGIGTPEDMPSLLYDKALIMGPYHDLDPSKTTSPTRKVQYQVFGTAPYRRFILSYYKIPLFSNPCNTLIENTHQIVLYESTGVIEIYIKDMEVCPTWNQGRAMVGIQNMDRTVAYMAPGRKASDPSWGFVGMNEVWRFIPSSGASLFKRAELYDLAGNLVSSTAAAASSNGNLSVSFGNVCSPVGTTSFVIKSVYTKIDNAALEVSAFDTIRVNKTQTVISATISTQASHCSPFDGTVTVNPTAGLAPLQFSIDGGSFQSSPSFTGISSGDHTITVKDASGCTNSFPASVALINDLSLDAMDDTTVCSGVQFTPSVTSNGSSFSWTPNSGVSDATLQKPLLSPVETTRYFITATLGNCIAKDSFLVTVHPKPLVSAGDDIIIIEGDVVTLNGSAAPGNYLWSPATGLNTPTILRPSASPVTTTNYTLKVTDTKGCTATDDVRVTVFPNCVKPMEAFTPNGDGVNDKWMVTNGSCTNSIRVQVFNRYGSPVFSSDSYNNDWDGRYKNQALPDGTYYYVITLYLVNGKSKTVKGNVTILR
jgi:gliding motility-associated-like protein